MSTLCQNLPLYFDGELPAAEEENFRHHLARCEDCAHQLHELMQLELLGQQALVGQEAPAVVAPPEPVAPPAPEVPALPANVRPLRPRSRVMWSTGAVAALAAGVLVMVTLSMRSGPADDWVARTPTRGLEARLTWSSADKYRPYVPMRGGAGAAEAPLPLRELARMEERGDLLGIADAYLLHGDAKQAAAYLGRVPASLDRDCDRAVVAMESGNYEEALTLLDGVLKVKPDHPQALWNRGLVLREMGLTMMAAEAFDAVAKLGEPGWAEEARERARVLRQETMDHTRSWNEAYAASRALITTPGARLPLSEAKAYPGVIRFAFYDALRSAASREQALALAPLAEALDDEEGGTVLRDTVARVAARDFRKRAPLAKGYAQLAREEHPSAQAFLEQLSRSGEDDLYLGALLLLEAAPRHIDAFVRTAREQKDSVLELLAERELAAHEERQGQWWKAEERLQSTLRVCQERGLPYRCVTLEKRLADLYLNLHRLSDAYEHAWSGWTMAKKMGDVWFERSFLQELAQIALLRRSLPSARAYLQESLLRGPAAGCVQRTYIHRNLAQIAYLGFRMDEARRELDLAAECGQPLGLAGVATLSELAHYGIKPGDAEHLHQTLDELRRADPSPGGRALMALIEGRFELERDRTAGRKLLQEALAQADALPSDVNARRARAFAYSSLILDAGRTGAYEEALGLMAAELRVDVPSRCVLGVAVEHERTLVVARGSGGELLGHYDASRAAPLGEDVSGLVPERMRQALGGCEHVDVLARPPVHGHTGLLPMGMAWSYRVGRGTPETRPAVEGKHLVVTDVDIPRSLQLPRLPPLAPSRIQDPARVVLAGTQATPSRVLAQMGEASEIEIHSHGLISPEVSDASLIVLAPESDGRYALTASQIREQRLAGAPLVLLATCSAAKTAPFPHEPFSLPVAFIEAGARTVLASTVDIPDSAGRFFDAVRERIRAGARPSIALRDERQRWLESNPESSWVSHVLLFE